MQSLRGDLRADSYIVSSRPPDARSRPSWGGDTKNSNKINNDKTKDKKERNEATTRHGAGLRAFHPITARQDAARSQRVSRTATGHAGGRPTSAADRVLGHAGDRVLGPAGLCAERPRMPEVDSPAPVWAHEGGPYEPACQPSSRSRQRAREPAPPHSLASAAVVREWCRAGAPSGPLRQAIWSAFSPQ